VPKIKEMAKGFARAIGYRISVYRDPFDDVRTLIGGKNLIIFDIGANVGQTIATIRRTFDDPVVHAFEPSPKCFKILQMEFQGKAHLNQCAVGAQIGEQEFREAGSSVMSSLLDPAAHGWNGKGWNDVVSRYPVKVTTIDSYCAERKIDRIDVLKTDTQGYDLQVLKGARKMLGSIKFIYVEMNLIEMYEGQASFDDLYRFLSDHNFVLKSIYETHASWVDGLFVNGDG
jgi:FkbM family methyltransferase